MDYKTFQLDREPYGERPDPRFFFESPVHVKTFRAAARALKANKRLVLLTGRPGSGKSLLARCLLLKIAPTDRSALVVCTPDDSGTLVGRISRAFGVGGPVGGPAKGALAALWSSVRGRPSSRMIVVIDQAEHLPKCAVAELVQLVGDSGGEDGAPLQVVLVGTAGTARTVLETGGDEKGIVCIEPLDDLGSREVAAYIAHRWAVAGGTRRPPFTDGALRLIAERTGGSPRCVNRLCASLLTRGLQSGASEVDAELVDRVSASAEPWLLNAEIRMSEQDAIEGSMKMANPSKVPARVLTEGSSAAPTGGAGAPHAVRGVTTAPASGGNGPELLGLVERLERALERAPSLIEAAESATSKTGQMLQRFESRATDLERQHDSLSRSLGGLEDACGRADQVRHCLADFVDQLAGIGDASQEKVALLLDSLELGNKTRRELETVAEQAAGTSRRLESTAGECERRISSLAESLADEQKRSHRALLEELTRIHECKFAAFGENGEHVARLEEITARGIETIGKQAEEKGREVESAVKRRAKECESKISECEARLTQSALSLATEQKRLHQARIEEIEHVVKRHLAPFGADGEHVSRLAKLTSRGIATIGKYAEEKGREIEEAAKQRAKEYESKISEYETRLAESVKSLATEQNQAHHARLEEIDRVVKENLSPFGANGEHVSRLATLTSRGIETIGEYADRRGREIESAAEQHAKACESKIAEHQSRLAEIAERIADKSAARVVQMIHTKREELEEEIERHLASFGPSGEHAARLGELVERGVAAIKAAADERAQGFGETIQPALAQFEKMIRAYEKRASDAADRAVARTAKAVDDAANGKSAVLKETADELLAQFRNVADELLAQFHKAADAGRAQLASRIQAADEAVHVATEGTAEANKILKTLIQNRDFTYEKRLAEVADASTARVVQTIDAKCNALEKEIDRRLEPFAPTGEHTAHLAELISRGVESIKTMAEEKSREVRSAMAEQRKSCELEAAEYESRLVEITERVVEESASRVVQATQAKRDELQNELQRRLAPFGPTGEHTIRLTELVSRGVETITGVVEQARRESDDAVRRQAAEYASKASEYESKLAELTDEAAGRVVEMIQRHAGGLKKELSAHLAPFGPAGDHTVRLKELAATSIETMRSVIEEGKRDVGDTVNRRVRECEAKLSECEARFGRITDEAATRRVHELRAQGEEIKRELDDRVAAFGPSGEHTRRLTQLVERGADQIRNIADERMRDFKEHVQPAFERFESTVQGLEGRATEAVDKGVARSIEEIAKATSRGTLELRKAVDEQIVHFHTATEAKSQQLASQLQAGSETVRMVSEATREGRDVLNTLIQNHDAVECQIRKLNDDSERAGWAASKLEELQTTADPTITELRQSLKGTDAAVAKIERMIQDVWTLATTAEERARELRECSASSAETIERLHAAQRESEASETALTEKNEGARRRAETLEGVIEQSRAAAESVEKVCRGALEATSKAAEATVSARAGQDALERGIQRAGDAAADVEGAARKACAIGNRLVERARAAEQRAERQDAAAERCEQIIGRLEVACAAASDLAEHITQTAEQARVNNEGLEEKLRASDESLAAIRNAGERLATQTTSAEQAALKHQAAADVHRKALEELRQHINRGQEITRGFEQSLAKGGKIRDALAAASKDATKIGREITELLPTIAEQRDVFDSNQQSLNYCVERAETLGVKLKQLQTRADAFEHQLSGMLAEPHRIVEESKTQTGQLSAVCTAVRKVFAGLSKTSLAANRDISRFSEISREANEQLARLTAETTRASQTLRQWVDEASHAQSRLAKSLGQVPSINRTHPTAVLKDLAEVSPKAIPEVLKLGGSRQAQDSPGKSGNAATSGVADRLSGKTDIAGLIREAERVAEAMG